MSKLGILLGAGVGYVLGTRDGRERYDQIRQQAQRLWHNPRVQETKEQAQDVAKQKGSELQDKAAQKAGESSDSTSTTTTSSSGPASGAFGGAQQADSTPGGLNG